MEKFHYSKNRVHILRWYGNDCYNNCDKQKSTVNFIKLSINYTYHVYTSPEFDNANENCDPHSTLMIPTPIKSSILIGNLQPSLPPRPNFPKSPSPHDQTQSSSVIQSVCASPLPHAISITLNPWRASTNFGSSWSSVSPSPWPKKRITIDTRTILQF